MGRSGELAPRAWGEIAVASLLALNDPKLDKLVTAYCQQFGIVSRVASFLVLENDADYKRLNLEEERGKTLTGDLGEFLTSMWQSLSQEVSPRKRSWNECWRSSSRSARRPNGAQIRKLLAC